MANKVKTYDLFTHLVMRFPRYSVDTFVSCLSDESKMERVFCSEDFKNAILFASPALYDEMKRFLSGENKNPSNKQKIRLSLLKYLARMSSRCTPFASLASCGCLAWGDTMHIVCDEARVESFRLDMLYCCMIAQKLIHDHDCRRFFSFCANSTIYRTGSHIRYVSFISLGQGRAFQVKELKLSSPLRWVLNHTKSYVPFYCLVDQFMSHFEVNREDTEHYLHTLIDSQLLVSDIDPMVTGEDMLENLAKKTENVDKTWYNRIKSISQGLKAFSSLNPSQENEASHRQIQVLLDHMGIKPNPKYLVQLDSFSVHEQSIVDKRIVLQLKQGMDFLCRVMPISRNANLEQFKQRFATRYQDQEIPLLEALDPDIGVGYVLTQDRISNPLIDGLRLPIKQQPILPMGATPLQQVLLQKLSEHDWSKSKCIKLTDEDVKHLPLYYNDLPVTMAALFEILGKTGKGDYLLGDLRFTGSSAANLLGRFAYRDESIKDLISHVTDAEQLGHNDKIIAEIAHVPQSRTGNILSRPHLRDYEIIYLSNSLLGGDNLIPANDLLVSVKQNRVVLRSRRFKKEILPRLTTAHNYSGTDPTPVYRFLCDLQHQNGRTALMFNWGGLSSIDHLPRVMYRNIILSRERWTMRQKQLPFDKKTISEECLQRWYQHYQLPQYVSLVAGDNKLLVDTHNKLSVEMMLSEIGRGESFVFEEFIISNGVSPNSQGMDCQNECIVPLFKTNHD